ncbi:hypothetical protein [Bacillus sp. FJAT-45350]|uniref:hypothetical protein n=1 Tax=Bacillus sp. FJAT-45350 TaxID=2011014 RepID=UPI000BB8A9A0|nr:hypothetical protein [Bacillus sp. FJAT-45350]
MVKSLNGKGKSGSRNQDLLKDVKFEDLYNVRLLRGKHPNFTKETYVVLFESNLAGNYVNSYLLHELSKNEVSNSTAAEAFADLEVSGYITRQIFSDMVTYANFLKLHGEFEQVENLIPYLGDACDSSESLDNLKQFENYILANLENIPHLSNGTFDPKSHGAVILDREETVEKYDGVSVGVTKNTLMNLFIEGYDESGKSNDNHLNGRLKAIIKGWIAKGICISKTTGRNQEVIYKPSKEIGSVKLYVIHCPRVEEEVVKNDRN